MSTEWGSLRLNLYEFSQVNNNEMGILIRRSEDAELYREAYEEAQRIIRISDEVRISMERVATPPEEKPAEAEQAADAVSDQDGADDVGKLTSSKLARKLGLKTGDFLDRMVAKGHLELKDGKQVLTDAGKAAGGELRVSPRFGAYFLWPEATDD
ncbi:hypothetical protein [Novilysobacter avium]|uniref:DNA-binding protein n=1 Tax=Novilysobacter avium TaxID=2781023 RepID=A0A7S6UJC6_9GAMM|nr:hypothetical protein [Lysobacter avium]QOW21342.1 hypothetical protein INQ42_08675 [Lysobacter avium]